MSKKRNLDAVMGQGPMLVEFYRNNPCIAAYELLGVDLAPIQRIVFEDMWFRDYTITVAGRGLGKCSYVAEMTHFSDIGLVYLNEVLPPIPTYLSDGEEEVLDYTGKLYTTDGFKPIKKLVLEKGIDGKRITTRNGLIKRGSTHHPLLVLNNDCDFKYKKLDEFVVGDKVCIQRDQQTFGSNSMSEEDAYLTGLLIGAGSIANKNSLTLTSEDPYILNFCTDFCINNNLYCSSKLDKRTKSTHIIRFSNKLNRFLSKYNVARVLSYDKVVPYYIRTSTRKVQIAFLQGYFDTDGTADKVSGGVSCCSVSKKLLQEIQMMLLNFGIVAKLRKKKTNSKFGMAYLLDMFSVDAFKFKELIGFRLKRKQVILNNYFDSREFNVNKDTIPNILDTCWDIRQDFLKLNSKKHNDPVGKLLPFKKSNKKEVTYILLHKFISDINNVLGLKYRFSNKSLSAITKLKEILYYNYYFDTVTIVEDWKGDCYDFEMDMSETSEPNYFSNGFINHNTFLQGTLAALSCLLYPGYRVGLISPSFRQAKMIFAEVEKHYTKSPILREATEKRPIRGSDTAYLKYKSVGGQNGSILEAIPLGNDGAKIRGSRFYLICVDELAQVPDKILDMVLRPMGATKQDPMVNVRKLEQMKVLIAAGLATEEDFEETQVNKMIMTSSGFYKFNHMYRRMRSYWHKMDIEGYDESRAMVHQIPYHFLPEGFLDSENIAEAKRVMSDHEFRMEYEAEMISDSEGFFKASLLATCTIGSDFSVETHGEKSAEYIIGIDPNQGGSASCGVVIIRLGTPNKIVNAIELKGTKTQELVTSIQELCSTYNVVRAYIDKGGGGKAVCDLLEEGYNNAEPLIDRTNDDHRYMEGRHIIEMINFSTKWISDANFATLALLEDKLLLFPEQPQGTTDKASIQHEVVEKLKKQMLNIVVTQTAGGALHFDTPKKGQNKDLYSAIILAGYGVRAYAKELEDDGEPVLHNTGGMVRERNVGTSFRELSRSEPNTQSYNVSMAVLNKKIK